MVLWSKPRQEKAIARYLHSVRANYYLPLVRRVRFARGRKHASMLPLFPGYLFLEGTREDGYDAISTGRVCQVLEIADQARFAREVGQIHAALTKGGSIEPYAFAENGRRCRVVAGPFMGFEGVISRRLGSTRLVLQLSILGQGAALEIDIDLLEPVD